jgi:hypothetical protein
MMQFRKICFNILFLIIILVIISSPFVMMGYAYSIILQQDRSTKVHRIYNGFFTNPSRKICETFKVDIYLWSAENVSAWQVKLAFDPYSLTVLNVEAGDLMSSNSLVINATWLFYSQEPLESYINSSALNDYALVIFATDVAPGTLLIGGCYFDLRSISGSVKVATITFGIWDCISANLDVFIEESLLLDKELTETNRGTIIVKR